MGLEMPAFAAAVSRLPNEAVHLAAFSSVVYPISMVVEGPIVMLLAASTALVVDRAHYRALRKFTVLAALALTMVHALVAFTPVYDVLATQWIQLADEALEPGRLGLQIMLPWSAAIAYRRFQQGVLIRYQRARDVAAGTLIRLVANGSVLVVGVALGTIDGIVVGAVAISTGVLAEAAWAAWRTAAVVRERVPELDPDAEPFALRSFLHFYTPLALTPLITLAMQPITAAAIWRMPQALASSASWSAVYGLIFLFRALGFAFQEVVVSFGRTAEGRAALGTFAARLALTVVTAFACVAFTPLGSVWFGSVLDLAPELATLGASAIGFGLLLPLVAVGQHYEQGLLVAARRTRAITEAVAVYLGVAVFGFFGVAIHVHDGPGVVAALVVLTIAGTAQLAWLRWRRIRSQSIMSAADAPASQAATSR